MHTSELNVNIGRRRRRRHSAAFKAESVAACLQPGVSIAAAALSRGLNANLLRRWVIDAERAGTVPGEFRSDVQPAAAIKAGFVPVAVSCDSGAMIRIEIRRGSCVVNVQWPASAARECALLLRELMQ